MPVTLAQITANTASVTLHIGEDTLTIAYYPGRVTEKSIAALGSFSAMNESTMQAGFKEFNVTLATLIQSWDLMDGDAMFPIDATRFAELPVAFRVQVLTAIMGDISPNGIASQITN